MKTQELIDLKKKISESELERARLEGNLENLKEQMVKDFGVSTIEEAEEKLKALDSEIERKEKEIETKMADLRERYDF